MGKLRSKVPGYLCQVTYAKLKSVPMPRGTDCRACALYRDSMPGTCCYARLLGVRCPDVFGMFMSTDPGFMARLSVLAGTETRVHALSTGRRLMRRTLCKEVR